MFLTLGNLFSQSGWTKSKSAYFGKLDFTSFTAEKYYTLSGKQLTTNAFKQNSVNLFFEYGITDQLTAILNVPLLRINSFETSNAVFGNGDARIELKYRITSSSSIPLAVSIAPELPIGRANALASNKINPVDKINLPLGDGEFNVWSTVAISLPLGKAYISSFGAYNWRTKYEGKSFRDQYQFGAEVGVNPLKPLWMNAKLRGQYAIGESRHPDLSFVRGDATTYTLISFEAFYKINQKLGFSATYLTGANLLAPYKNIYIAPYFSLGIIYQKI